MSIFGSSRRNSIADDKRDEAALVDPNAGFWGGGEKFRARDGIAGLLAVLSDALGQQSGSNLGVVPMLAGGRFDALDAARKAQAKQQEMDAARQRAQAAGLGGPQADLMAHGDAKYSDLAAKPVELPSDARLAQWYQNANPQERAAFDQIRPIITNGYGSSVVPRAALPGGGGMTPPGSRGLPPGYDPEEWEPVDGPQQPQPQALQAPQAQQAPVLTQEQWRGAVDVLGAGPAEEWRRRHGYQIGNR